MRKLKPILSIVIIFLIFSCVDVAIYEEYHEFFLRENNNNPIKKLKTGNEIKLSKLFINISSYKKKGSKILNIIADLYSYNDEYYFNKDNIKSDFKEIAEMVNEYALFKKWKGYKNIYVKTSYSGLGPKIIYYNSDDKLYLPKHYDFMVKCIKKFKTDNIKEIAKTKEGTDFCVQNGFGYYKDGKFFTFSTIGKSLEKEGLRIYLRKGKIEITGDYDKTLIY